MDLAGYIAMLLVGASLGLLGGGGAILTVPIMVYLFGKSPTLATSYSLFIVGVSSLFGVWRYHSKKLVAFRVAVNFAAPSFFGTFAARRLLMPALPDVILRADGLTIRKDQLIMLVFALVMLGASASMIRRSGDGVALRLSTGDGRLTLGLLGLAVGFVAGFVGAGGGFLIIPALVVVAKMEMPTAVGTSLLIISANSLFGFAGDLAASKEIDWRFLGTTTGIALIGISFGTYVSRFIPTSKLKPAFGWFVLVMGGYVLLSQLYG